MASNPIHEADLEMSAVASTSAEQEDASDVAIKKAYGQMEVPLRKKEHTFMGVRFDPTFYKCDGKIVKYDSSGLSIWKVSPPPIPCLLPLPLPLPLSLPLPAPS